MIAYTQLILSNKATNIEYPMLQMLFIIHQINLEVNVLVNYCHGNLIQMLINVTMSIRGGCSYFTVG